MKKLNLNNKVSGDDDTLINILKESIGHETSEQFAENILEKFLTLKTKQNIVYKPLKSPLYMMLVIVLILVIPGIFSFGSKISLSDTRFDLENFFANMALQLDSWYMLSPMVLVLVLLSVVWIELGLVKLRNPFV